MTERFDAANIEEVDDIVKYFSDFHDDYVAGIEIKFENYKALNEDGESIGIQNVDKTIILTVNTYPYKKEHNKLIQVEFKDVKSYEISSERDDGPKAGPVWGISEAMIDSDGDDIQWEFYFLVGGAKFTVICSKIAFIKTKDTDHSRKHGSPHTHRWENGVRLLSEG